MQHIRILNSFKEKRNEDYYKFGDNLNAIANDKFISGQISQCKLNSPRLFGNSRHHVTSETANLDDETHRYPPKCNEIN
jgi:hypothetical protein